MGVHLDLTEYTGHYLRKPVGHADGDFYLVVERLQAGVAVAKPDGPQDVVAPTPDLLAEFDDFGDAAVAGPEYPPLQLGLGLFDGLAQEGPEEFLELPGAVELAPGVRVPERLQHPGLRFGQVAGVLEHGVFQAAHRPGRRLVLVTPGLVPQPFPDPVQRVGHPGDDVERIQHALGVRAVLGDGRVDPPGPVSGDDADGRALLVGQLPEEQVEDLPAVPVVRPDHAPSLVVGDDGDVRVALPAAGLVHADRVQSVEHARHRGFQPVGDPARDVAGGAPRDMQESADGLLVGDRHQPRALHLEIPGEPAARLRPRHARDDHAVHTAFHTRNRAVKLDPEAAKVLVPPTSIAAPVVVFRAFASTARAAQRRLSAPHPDLQHGSRA